MTLAGARPPAPALFAQWEAGGWTVGSLSFEEDRAQWDRLEPADREAYRALFCMIHLGEEAVVDRLSPLLASAACPEDKVLVAYQVADEARHLAFMDRFAAEVLGLGKSPQARREAARAHVSSGYAAIFEEFLGQAAEALEGAPGDPAAAVRLVTCYHLLVEGAFGLVAQPLILGALRGRGLFPGFRRGFEAVARDEHRHVALGVSLLRRAVRAEPGLGAAVGEAFGALAASWDRLTEPPDLEGFFATLGTTREAFAASSLRWLGRRLAAVDASLAGLVPA